MKKIFIIVSYFLALDLCGASITSTKTLGYSRDIENDASFNDAFLSEKFLRPKRQKARIAYA